MKRPPPFLLPAVLIFWGWQTELLIFGLVMAVIVEPARYVKTRWDLSPSDFRHIADLCAVLLIGAAVWVFSSSKTNRAIIDLLRWLPVVFFPLVATQFYSVAEKIDISAISLISRRLGKSGGKSDIALDLSWPFFAMCVVSAGSGNMKGVWFYAGVLVLGFWALLRARSKRYSAATWAVLFVIAGASGFAGQSGLHRLQVYLEMKTQGWFSGSSQDANPYRSMTAIGDMGKLKPSNRIVFRVEPDPGTKPPWLLREASYVDFGYSRWTARGYEFKGVFKNTDRSWQILDNTHPKNGLTVCAYLSGGMGMLKMPGGACRIENLPDAKLERNALGAIKVDGPGLIAPKILFDPDISSDAPPDERDLAVSERETRAVMKTVDELGLSAEFPESAIKKTDAFFRDRFTYSLDLSGKSGQNSPVSDFLLRSRSGHCEYFATATVLLLRGAGIPARYAKGYSVHEYSELENRYVVREAHAHAWAIAYIDGIWRDVDLTPGAWSAALPAKRSVWDVLSDLRAWLVYEFLQWRMDENSAGIGKYFVWLLLPLTAILVRRLMKKRVKKKPNFGEKSAGHVFPGTDSEFYKIERTLAESGFGRYSGETLFEWLNRIAQSDTLAGHKQSLSPILLLHHKYRFDPDGISRDEESRLRALVYSWLDQHAEAGRQ